MKHARQFAAVYLLLQSLAACAWWLALFFVPATRRFFIPREAPDVMLLAFALPDAVLFIGCGFWAAHGVFFGSRRAELALALHTGGALYAVLFCLLQWLLSGQAWLAALLMAPCLVVQPFLLWKVSAGESFGAKHL